MRVPKQFGRSGLLVEPAEGIDRDDARFQAAQLQHVIANAAREALLARGHTLRSYVGEFGNVPGMTYERLVRIQRGETMMQLADLMAWASRFETVRDVLATSRTWPETNSLPNDHGS